jgi:adenylate cyclase
MTVANPGGPHARRTPTENGALPAWGGGAWLRGADALAHDDAGLVCALGRQLYGAGLGIDRLAFHVGTLHPEIFARVLAWAPNEPVEVYEQDHPATVAAGFPDSPFRQAVGLQQKLVARNVAPQFLGRAAGALLQSRGLGELVCAPLGDRSGRTVVLSFCVAQPNRFSAADHRMIDCVIGSLPQGGRRPARTA